MRHRGSDRRLRRHRLSAALRGRRQRCRPHRPRLSDRRDTLEIHGQRIRLFGIDAPESRQTCEADGQTYRCGQQAALALADHVGQRTVACEQRDVDRYGRIVAVCHAGGEDLNAWLVTQGWALAYRHYSTAYVDEEDAARAAYIGIWRGAFTAPWDWRHGQRAPSTSADARAPASDEALH